MKLFRVIFMLLISFLSIEPASSEETDTILIQNNEPQGYIGIWISEPHNGTPKGSTKKVMSDHTGQSITGSFSGEPGAIIAFAENRTPTLQQNINWSGGQTVPLRLENPITISLHTWVAAGDFSKVRDAMTHAITWVNGMFRREHQGITIRLPDDNISDFTNAASNSIDRYKNIGTAFSCSGSIKKDIGFVPKSINIYIVKAVDGHNGSSGTAGVACLAPDNIIVIAIGEDTDIVHLGGLLAHELGHLLSLEHWSRSSDETNVMVPISTTRAFLTEGQTFRAIYQQASELNRSLNNPPRNRTTLTCPEDYGNTTSYYCPPLDMRIWEDILIAHPPGPVDNIPFRVALKKYLNEDHKDFFNMKVELAQKEMKSDTLKKLLEFAASDPTFISKKLEPLLLMILNKDVNEKIYSEFLSEYRTFLTNQWERRAEFLRNKQNIKRLGFTKRQLKLVNSLTFEQYEKAVIEGLKRRYQEKAVIALVAIGSPQGKTALKNFKTNDKGLRDSIDYHLKGPGIINKPDIGREILERHD